MVKRNEKCGEKMNKEKLSKRLETVSSYIPKGSRVADIGSDHAYLPCYVIKNEMAKFAIAGEVVEGPFQMALKQVKSAGLDHSISVRKGDGLEVLEVGEVDCITIAGMGGSLISSILNQGLLKLSGVQRLILQPNVGAISIRKWSIKHHWKLVSEEIIEEDQKIYEILVLEPINNHELYILSEAELLMGPYLIKEKNQVFIEKWRQESKKWERIIENINHAEESIETIEKKKILQHHISLVKGVIS
jgi:tRNA (adenine22-N1)-methyltransferase